MELTDALEPGSKARAGRLLRLPVRAERTRAVGTHSTTRRVRRPDEREHWNRASITFGDALPPTVKGWGVFPDCRFYLGTHMPGQAWFDLGVPLFVSRVRLAKRKSMPRASAPWALDSAGFTALHTGGYPVTVAQYAAEVLRYSDEIGHLAWAAAMDYMCEPSALSKSGGTVAKHQRLTIDNFLSLREIVGSIAAPVLQGWDRGDHERHADMYDRAGVDLTAEAIVGVGSICRRNADEDISAIVRPLAATGLRVHGFGIRTRALAMLADVLASADSMAWSSQGRRMQLPGCRGLGHRSEANCKRWALLWREAQVASLAQSSISETAA